MGPSGPQLSGQCRSGCPGERREAPPAGGREQRLGGHPLRGAVHQVFAPASGALLAYTEPGLHRSDDGGTTWRQLALPAAPPSRWPYPVVDPTNHGVIYAIGYGGLHKSSDGAAAWRLLNVTGNRITVSPADPRVVYVLSVGNTARRLRSGDAGETWQEIHSWNPGDQTFLVAHPTDSQRVFVAVSTLARANPGTIILQSADGGAT
jgi:hypothetical protein